MFHLILRPMKTDTYCTITNRTLPLLLVLFMALMSSCHVTSQIHSQVNFEQEPLSAQLFEEGGLVFLPVVATTGAEAYRRPFSDSMHEIAGRFLFNYVPVSDFLFLIDEAGLVTDYSRSIQYFRDTGVMDRQMLRKLSEQTDCRYFLFVQIFPPVHEQKFNYTGSGGYARDIRQMESFAIVWDAYAGEEIWDGRVMAQLSISDNDPFFTRETDLERVEKVAAALMAELGISRK